MPRMLPETEEVLKAIKYAILCAGDGDQDVEPVDISESALAEILPRLSAQTLCRIRDWMS